MAIERKKEKEKSPAELALEQTSEKPKTPEGEEKAPEAKRPATTRKAAPAKAKSEKPTRRAAPRKARAAKEVAEGRTEPAGPAEPAEPKKPTRRRAPARRAPGRRREAPEPAPRAPSRPVVRARAKYVRSSARKARLVIEHIRGKSVVEARAVLRHTPRAVARDIEKLLSSAVANAENNHELVGDDLYVKEAYADEGPTLKRFRPRALGRATRIRKRTSHLTLTLTPKDE
jgi:ribosomal protein L22